MAAASGAAGTPSPRAPPGVIDASNGLIACYGQIKAVLREIGNFIDSSERVIRDELTKPPKDEAGH